MRRTSLSAKQLYELITSGGAPSGGCGQGPEMPACFYVNELGLILLWGDEDEKIEAKEALINLLSSKEASIAGTAYCFLYKSIPQETEVMTPKDEDIDLVRVIAEFENDPKNEETLALAKMTLSRNHYS